MRERSVQIKEVYRDGIKGMKVFCPKCHALGTIDADQYRGEVSLFCDCGFHVTCDFSKNI